MTERIVTITLSKEPNYYGSPRVYPEGDPRWPQLNAVAGRNIPYLSTFAKSKYGLVLDYLRKQYSQGESHPNHYSYVRMKAKVSNGNWKKRKKDGEIVFANYKAGKLRAGFTNRKRYTSDLSLKHHEWDKSPVLPFQVTPFPKQAIANYNQLGTNPGLMWSKWWVPNEGVLPDTSWAHIIQVDERLPYDENHMKAMLASLSYGKDLIDDGLVTQTLAQLNQKELDILTEVAEIAKTCATIERSLRAILAIIFKFKSSIRYLTGPGAFKKASELWLECRYGIRPLIYSVESSLKVLQGLGSDSEYIDAKKKKTITRPSPLNPDIEEKLTLRCLIRRQYKYSDLIGELGSKFISADPLVTAWEITAGSFVVDWVLDVGSFLQAIGTFTPRSSQQNATFSIKAECAGSTPREFLDYTVYTRYVISPETHITIPVQLNLDIYKLVDLAALVRTISKDVMDLKKRNKNVH